MNPVSMMTAAPTAKGFSLDEDRGVLVVTLFWESILRESALEELRQRVVSQLSQATTAVLFDCRQLTGPATSQFLATLVAVRKAAMREGLFVCVTNLEGPVRQSYMVSRLDRIIPLYDDRETALRAVGDYGLGRIAVGKLEPERLAAASGTAEKPTRAPGPSASVALAGQASAAMASAAESWAGVGQKLHHASQTITRQQMLQLGGAAALVLVLGSVAYYLLAPARSDGAISSSDDRPLSYGGEGPLALSGQVQVRAGDHAREDSGALILLWPAGETPPQKVLTKTIYRYLNEAAVSDEFPHPWMHAARASETGKFRIGLKTPGEFEVLIISASTESSSTLTSADEQTLAAWFESPRELIGRHPYRLQRQRVDNSAAALSQIFERRGSR